MIRSLFRIFLFFCVCFLFSSCEKKPEKQGAVNNTGNYSYESGNHQNNNEAKEDQATELEQFLYGTWYMTYDGKPDKNKKDVMIRYMYFDSVHNISFNKDSKEEPGLIFTESGEGDLIGVKARWTADKETVNFSRVLYFSPWEPEYIYNFYKNNYYDDTWKIEITDQNKINIIKNGYEGEYKTQYIRETGREIKELIDHDNVKELEKYLKEGNDINGRMIYNFTPLMYAIYYGKIKTAHLLIEKGADLELKCDLGYTPLHYAVMHSKIEDDILLKMLNKDLDINIRDDFDQTPLDLTIIDRQTDGNKSIQKLLYENGAECTRGEWLLEVEANIDLYLLKTFTGFREEVRSVVYNKDGTQILCGMFDNTAKILDASSGNVIRTFQGHSGNVYRAVFTPDERRIVTSSGDKTVKIWDAVTGKNVMTLSGHTDWIYAVAVSPNGRQIISGSRDKTIRVWDASNGKELRNAAHRDTVNYLEYSPNGSYFASSSYDDTAVIWNAANGQSVNTFSHSPTDVYSANFSPDGSKLLTASGDRTLKLWDTASGRVIRTFTGHTSYVLCAAFSSDGKFIVSGADDYTIRIWNVETGLEVRRFGHRFDQNTRTSGKTNEVSSVAFSPDGKTVVSSSKDRTIRIWNAQVR